MKIAIDIDNTICDTSKYYGELAIYYDRNILHKNNNINFNKVVPRSDDWTKEELAFFIENHFNKEAINIPIKEDVSLYINKLKDLGFKIIFLTNRGIKDDDYSDLIVSEYLDKHNIPYDEIITKAKDKYLYLSDCDYFIDDEINNCEMALEKTNCHVIMMLSNRVKDYSNDKMFISNSWEEIFDFIVNKVRNVYK